MNTYQAISKDLILPEKLLLEPSVGSGLLYENLIIERRKSINWLQKLYKGSALHDFWLLLSSPVS